MTYEFVDHGRGMRKHHSPGSFSPHLLICLGMPYKPLSDHVKKHKVNEVNNTHLQKAARVYLAAKDGPNKLSFRQIEKMFPGVKKSTLERFINRKGRTMLEFNSTKQRLTPIEENVLVNLILESADRGFPL